MASSYHILDWYRGCHTWNTTSGATAGHAQWQFWHSIKHAICEMAGNFKLTKMKRMSLVT